jgi:hypothetical protein
MVNKRCLVSGPPATSRLTGERGAPAHPLAVAGRAPAARPLLLMRAQHLSRVAGAAGRVLAGRVLPVLAGGLAEIARGVLRDGAGAFARARPERHPPEPADLVRRAAAGPVHPALTRLHAGVQILHRQLALQVPDDLVTRSSSRIRVRLHLKHHVTCERWRGRLTCVIRGRDRAVWRTAAAAHAISRVIS